MRKNKKTFQEETKMRKLHKLLGIALATTLCAATLFTGTSCKKEAKDTIAVIAKGETHAFWQSVKAGAVDAGKKYGYNVTFSGAPSENVSDAPKQKMKLQAAINNKATKAVVLATIGTGFQDEIKTAYEKGIPMVEFDSGLYNNGSDVTPGKDPRIGKVATDNRAAAALNAEQFFNYLKTNNVITKTSEGGGEFRIGIIQHDTTQTGIDRAAGFKEKMTELASTEGYNITWASTQVSEVKKYATALSALKSTCNAIFMSNEGVVNEVQPVVLNDSSYKSILFCGFDCGTKQYDWIKDAGNKYALLVGSVAQDSYNIGYKAVEMAAKKLKGETFESNIGIAGQWYTSANVDDLLKKNIFYKG